VDEIGSHSYHKLVGSPKNAPCITQCLLILYTNHSLYIIFSHLFFTKIIFSHHLFFHQNMDSPSSSVSMVNFSSSSSSEESSDEETTAQALQMCAIAYYRLQHTRTHSTWRSINRNREAAHKESSRNTKRGKTSHA